MSAINGYLPSRELTRASSGISRWSICEKNGTQFFIKEFLYPTHPRMDQHTPEETEELIRICDAFYKSRRHFYDVLASCEAEQLVKPVDFFLYDSRFYVVSHMIDAPEDCFLAVAALPELDKYALLRRITEGFHALHSAGIIHGDVKPVSILLTVSSGSVEPHIVGLDTAFLASEQPERMSTDLPFLAPEAYRRSQGDPAPVTEKIDIFALGLVFHLLWTGALPQIRGCSYAYETVPAGGEILLSNDIPEPLTAILRKMLAFLPEYRPTAAQLLELLDAASAAAGATPEAPAVTVTPEPEEAAAAVIPEPEEIPVTVMPEPAAYAPPAPAAEPVMPAWEPLPPEAYAPTAGPVRISGKGPREDGAPKSSGKGFQSAYHPK